MASKITSFPATGESETQNEHKRPLMPRELLVAAMEGNEAFLNQRLGLSNDEEDHPQPSKEEEEEEHPPHTMVSVDDDTPMEPSDGLIRSAAGMGDTILHILSANGHKKLVSKICMKDSSLLKAHNVRNETPFHHAARFGHKNTISKLIHCAKSVFGEDGLKELLRQKNCLGETALHEAARHGHGAVVSILMEEDIELAGLVNNDSVSPLYLATARGSVGMVHNMVEKLLGQEITPAFYSGPKQQTALFAAVLQDTELTKELLKLYSEPLDKETDKTGRTPLHFVASTGNYDIAKLLLEKDPSLAYIPDSDGSFPVHTAIRMGRFEMIGLLLQWCPDSGQLLDGNGKNILHIATEAQTATTLYRSLTFSKYKFTTSYLKKMFTRMVNTMDNKGNTPLHLAAEHGDDDVNSLLIRYKGDLTLQNKEGLTAPDIAVNQLRKYTKPTQNKYKHPVMPRELLVAAVDGDEGYLNQLLRLNNEEEDHPQPSREEEEEHPPHMMVSVDYDTPMEPSDGLIRSTTGMEDTILHILSANGHEKLVSKICQKDSSLLKAHNVRNETPFHHAARFGNDKTISKLICCAKSVFGEDGLKELLRQKNCLGETALHEAARHGHGAVVSILMEEDRELAGLVNNDSVSPLYLATARGSVGTVHNMVEKLLGQEITPAFYSGPKQQTALFAAVLQGTGREELAIARRSIGMVHNMVEKLLGQTALFAAVPQGTGREELAIARGSVGMVHNMVEKLLGDAVLQGTELTKELLKLYSEPLGKETDETGRTPLHFAASTGNHDIAKLLLEKDPSLAHIPDQHGSFPIHTAVRMGHIKTTRLLLQWCPDPCQLLDGNGKNILHIAMEAKNTNILYKLVNDSKDKIAISSWKKMLNRMANAMDNKGNTPLHLAAEHEDNDVMISLLDKTKVDLILQNKEGLTAHDIAEIKQEKYTNSYQDIMYGFLFGSRKDRLISRGWFQHYTKEQMSKTELIRGTNEDGISTTDTRGAKNSSESVMMKAQFVGLGSVLIATVTFAAAFTLPGGTNQDTGTPILGRKYIFKAFVIADGCAFLCSFLTTMDIIYTSCVDKSDMMESMVEGSLLLFAVAAKSMLIALGLGLYLMLAPIGHAGAVVLALSLFSALFYGNEVKLTPVETMKLDMVYTLRGEARCSLKLIAATIKYYVKFSPILITFLTVFLLALI